MNHIALKDITLKSGNHARRGMKSVCLMEAVAWFAGEKHTDHPECVSPVLAAFGRTWNDGMRSDAEREQLKQYIPLLVGTKSMPEVEEERAWLATDWLARVCAPVWLRLAKLDSHAEALLRLEPLVNAKIAALAQPTLDAVRDATRIAAGIVVRDVAGRIAAQAAAGNAAGDAAGIATRIAAQAAARIAVRDATRDTAGIAAGIAFRDTTRNTAGITAGIAAGIALELTIMELQTSAHDLYRKMILIVP